MSVSKVIKKNLGILSNIDLYQQRKSIRASNYERHIVCSIQVNFKLDDLLHVLVIILTILSLTSFHVYIFLLYFLVVCDSLSLSLSHAHTHTHCVLFGLVQVHQVGGLTPIPSCNISLPLTFLHICYT